MSEEAAEKAVKPNKTIYVGSDAFRIEIITPLGVIDLDLGASDIYIGHFSGVQVTIGEAELEELIEDGEQDEEASDEESEGEALMDEEDIEDSESDFTITILDKDEPEATPPSES